MKTFLTYSLLFILLIASKPKMQAQTVSSSIFILTLERDDTPPYIQVLKKGESNQIVINIGDNSGVDTVWFNDEVFLSKQDTLFSLEKEAKVNIEYWVKAVDIKGNRGQQTFVVDQTGILTIMRGVQPVPVISTTDLYRIKNAEYHALLIGVENYKDKAIEDLDYPIDDVEELYTILTEEYTFDSQKVQLLKDPTEDEIERAFDALKDRIGDDDNLLIFFAGHGYWNESSGTGFWFPSDAEKNRSSTWVRNSTIRDYIKEINSRHTLLIADACFGGSILKTRGIKEEEIRAFNNLYSLRSRKAMTSGTLQEVPDKSVFMKYLLQNLDKNTNNYISAESLFNLFKLAVMNNSSNVPQYGVIMDSGDEGGDFIFIRKPSSATSN